MRRTSPEKITIKKAAKNLTKKLFRLTRHTSIVICLAGILLYGSNQAQAAVSGSEVLKNGSDLSVYEGNPLVFENVAPKLPLGTEQFIDLTSDGVQGRLFLNAELFKDLSLLVYGGPENLQSNQFRIVPGGYYRQDGLAGEYRFHGFSKEGNLFTNQHFPNDADGTKTLSAKKWMHLPWGQIYGLTPSTFNQAALSGDPGALAWFDKALPFNILNSSNKEATKRGEGYSAAEHLLILSAPSAGMPGEGRMWHITDNHRWYQTFSLPAVPDARQQTPLTLQVQILDKGTHVFGPEETLPVRVRLTATLKDGAAFENPVQRALWMTRLEIGSWSLGEHTELPPRNLMSKVAFSTYNGIDAEKNATLSKVVTLYINRSMLDHNNRFMFTAESTVDYRGGLRSEVAAGSDTCQIGLATESSLVSSFSVADVHASTHSALSVTDVRYSNQSRGAITRYKWTLHEPATAAEEVFELTAGEMSDDVIASRLFEFIRSVMPEGVPNRQIRMTQTVYDAESKAVFLEKTFNVVIGSTAKAVSLAIDLPQWGFDVVSYAARDMTDHSDTAEFNVRVDGQSVDAAHFFSGLFKFSEVTGPLAYANRFVLVTVSAVSKSGVESYTHHWIEVVSTQPKALLTFAGPQKVNRKLTVNNISLASEDPRLAQAYSASYQFTYKAISGNDTNRRTVEASADEKHLLYKAPGFYQVSLTATNALGRVSEVYSLDIVIQDDRAPAVIFNLFSSVIARGETLDFVCDAASTDGDLVGLPSVRIYYDPGIDGIYEQLIGNFTLETLKTFKPTLLGGYRLIIETAETFGQPTLPAYVTAADNRRSTVLREFLCDNLRPVQTIDLEVPRTPEKVDVLVTVSSLLPAEDREYIATTRIGKTNQLRLAGLDAELHVWDLGGITNRVPAETTQIFGTELPPGTIEYADGGYYGTLSLVNTIDNGRYVDVGHYETKDVYTTEQVWVSKYCPEPDPFVCYVAGGYVDVYEDRVLHSIQTIWISDIQWRSNYYGSYEGEISRTLEQSFNPEWLRFGASRYVIYMGAPAETMPEPEVATLREIAGATWLVAGGMPALKDSIGAVHAVQGEPEPALDGALEWIGTRHEVGAEKLILLGESVNYHTVEVETEGDMITGEVYQVVQDPYFDNPLPQVLLSVIPEQAEPVLAGPLYNDTGFFTMTPPTTFDSVGHFEIFRKLRDVTGKAVFDLESNLDAARLTVHRKPVAALDLHARYDIILGKYRLEWQEKSYDLDHLLRDPKRGIVRGDLRLRPQGGSWRYGFPNALEGGWYEATYVVWDLEGQISEPVDYLFQIDNSSPEISFVSVIPDPAAEGDRPAVTLMPRDLDGDILTLMLTVDHNEISHQFEHSLENVLPGNPISLKLSEPLSVGTYTLTALVSDGRGAQETATRQLTVDQPGITEVKVTGKWNHWRGQIDRQGRLMALNPLRFLAYERLTIEVTAGGKPDVVTWRLSPELESMTFVDQNGQIYYYEEAFSDRPEFPLVLKTEGEDLYTGSYHLPLASSTLSWSDTRLKSPYWIEVTAAWGNRTEKYRIEGIELTGNVYDLIF